jgi:hypothetical protein
MLVSEDYVPNYHQPLQAIAIGTGESFYPWKDKWNATAIGPKPKLYGSGKCPLYINGLTAYGYCDGDNRLGLEKCFPQTTWHPDCRVYSTPICMAHAKEFNLAGEFLPFPAVPHGNSSGGMAISLACMENDVIGLIGFDGTRETMPDITDKLYETFLQDMAYLIGFWQSRGKYIYSLMEHTVFDYLLSK